MRTPAILYFNIYLVKKRQNTQQHIIMASTISNGLANTKSELQRNEKTKSQLSYN